MTKAFSWVKIFARLLYFLWKNSYTKSTQICLYFTHIEQRHLVALFLIIHKAETKHPQAKSRFVPHICSKNNKMILILKKMLCTILLHPVAHTIKTKLTHRSKVNCFQEVQFLNFVKTQPGSLGPDIDKEQDTVRS